MLKILLLVIIVLIAYVLYLRGSRRRWTSSMRRRIMATPCP